MKQIIFIGTFMLLLVGCGVPVALTSIPKTQTRAMMATPQIATITATFEPTQTPQPTVNMTAIAVTLSAYEAAEKQAIAEKLAAQAAQQNAVATAQEANVQALILTATLGAQNVEIGYQDITRAAISATQAAVQATQVSVMATGTANAPIIIKKVGDAQAEARTAPARLIIRDSLLPLLVVCATFLLWYILHKWAQPQPEKIDVNVMEGVTVQSSRTWAPIVNLSAINPPGDVLLFSKFAEYALNGGLLGINSVENRKAYPRTEYCKTLLPWLQEQDYLGHDEVSAGVVLNQKGKADFRLWLAEYAPPPQDDLSQNSTPSNHDYGPHDHGNGGGVVESEEKEA